MKPVAILGVLVIVLGVVAGGVALLR